MLRWLGFVVGATLATVLLMGVDRDTAVDWSAPPWAEPTGQRPSLRPRPASSADETAPWQPASPAETTTRTPQSSPPAIASQQAVLPAESAADSLAAPEEETGWYPLWRPFRSELSAEGFAGYLTQVSGRDTRVATLGPWSYRVEFAYRSKRDRDAALERLEQLIGVPLVGAVP